MPKKGEYVKGKNYETKTNPWVIMQILKVFYCQKLMESKIQKSFIYRNIKNILLGVMAFNQYELMICLVGLLNHTFNKDAFCNFINNMIEERKYCSDVIKKILTKNM